MAATTGCEVFPAGTSFFAWRQNAFYFFGTFLQLVLALAVGGVAHKVSLVAAFAILACVYGLAFVAASWPVGKAATIEAAGVELSQK